MAITITINGSVTLDESAGLQVGVATSTEDNNDSDLLLSTLPTILSNRLFSSSGSGGLGLSNAFATADGVAKSADNYITVSGTGAVVSLNFTTSAGAALPAYSIGVDPATGTASGLSAVTGGAITLFSDLSGRLALGVDTTGNIVFALFLDPAANLLSAKVWMVQFEALANTNPNSFDDPLSLTGLGVGAGASQEFNFDSLPSGANLFGIVGDAAAGLVVFGHDIGLKADNTFISNQTQEVKTSQAGLHATIGIESQMFDPGDSAYFTFVKNPDLNFTGFGLSSNEADDADNILYGSTLESDSAFLRVAQLQSGGAPTMSIQLFNINGSPQGVAMINARGVNAAGKDPDVTAVRVYAPDGTTLLESFSGGVEAGLSSTITISINAAGVATVSGFQSNNKIEWDADEDFDQVLITGVAGKFDIGGFGANEATSVSTPLTGVRFEDDGPSVDLVLSGAAELRVDESVLDAVDSIDIGGVGGLLSTNTATFGTDGDGGGGAPEYKLVLGADVTSGLFDTDTGLEVILSINAAGTLISGKVNDGGLVDVFTIAIDPTTGTVTLTQKRAMVNGDTADDDEADTPLTLATGTVSVQRTITDGDDDSASDTVDISPIFKFEDDGPSLQPAGEDVPLLITDDTDIGVPSSASVSTADMFPLLPDFGNDGPNQTDPILYSLRVVGTDPDSGLVDTATGKAILLRKVGNDVVGIVDEDGSGGINGTEALVAIRFALSVPDPLDPQTELVTFTQYRSVVHDDVNDDDESLSPETISGGLVFIDQTAVDGDGDVSGVVSFNLNELVQIKDDGTDIGPVANSIVDFAAGNSANEDLNGVVGKDPNASPYTLTSYTTNLTAGGVDLHAVTSGSATVGYWADTNGDTIFGNAGDTEYYRLVVGDQAGEGDYTFSVLVAPPSPPTEFNFDDLPSGANLFGIVGDASAGLVVFGKTIGLKADHTFISNQTQEVKTSQAGLHATIGIESQMFDPGDAAYFTFVKNPDPNFTGFGLSSNEADDADNILYGSTLENDSAFVRIAQLQSGGAPTMSIQLFNIDDSPQGVAMINARGTNAAGKDPDVTAVRVFAADGTTLLESYSGGVEAGLSSTITISINGAGVATVTGFGTNNKIEWDADEDFDQTLITGVAGKFDIGGFGFSQGVDTPDQVLNFTARVTDGDGDYSEASWKVGIDGTGIFDDNLVSGVII